MLPPAVPFGSPQRLSVHCKNHTQVSKNNLMYLRKPSVFTKYQFVLRVSTDPTFHF